MIAFRVQVNGDEAVTAGLAGQHVVSVHVNCRGRDPKGQASREPHRRVTMIVGGLQTSRDGSQVQVVWLNGPLTVGDEVRIAVVDVPESEISRPTSQRSVTPATESSQRERLAYLLKKYGAPAST